MSVRMEIYLVDWDDFQRAILREDLDEVLDRLESETLEDPSEKTHFRLPGCLRPLPEGPGRPTRNCTSRRSSEPFSGRLATPRTGSWISRSRKISTSSGSTPPPARDRPRTSPAGDPVRPGSLPPLVQKIVRSRGPVSVVRRVESLRRGVVEVPRTSRRGGLRAMSSPCSAETGDLVVFAGPALPPGKSSSGIVQDRNGLVRAILAVGRRRSTTGSPAGRRWPGRGGRRPGSASPGASWCRLRRSPERRSSRQKRSRGNRRPGPASRHRRGGRRRRKVPEASSVDSLFRQGTGAARAQRTESGSSRGSGRTRRPGRSWGSSRGGPGPG